MPAHPGTRLVQLGLKSLGADPGDIDGWFGRKTAAAGRQLLHNVPPTGSIWAFDVLQRGLDDLGWYQGPLSAAWSIELARALQGWIDSGGLPRSSAVVEEAPVAEPAVPAAVQPHGREIRQGSRRYLVDTFYLHTTATPGNWWRGKSNQQMFDEVRRWHVDPVWKGGRGWTDIGYHGLIFPDGECIYGRPLTTIGAGVIDHNAGSVHFSMVPIATITRMGQPADFYTLETIAGMKREIARVGSMTQLKTVTGHNSVAAKLCPGFIVVDRDWTDLAVA